MVCPLITRPEADIRRCIGPTGSINLTEMPHRMSTTVALQCTRTT
jgi:hypothetical protein